MVLFKNVEVDPKLTPEFAVTTPVAFTVVNLDDAAVVAPIGVLLIDPPVMIGDVNVLFVNVSVVARPTNVSVVSGSVNTLELVVGTHDRVIRFVPFCS